jgi:SulP family sulfate permease
MFVNERTALLPKDAASSRRASHRNDYPDVENQRPLRRRPWLTKQRIVTWPKERGLALARTATNPKTWHPKTVWREAIVKPIGYIPAVILGLLLNVLDALSYGQ